MRQGRYWIGMYTSTMHELQITLADKPGQLAKATEIIAAEKLNLEGGASFVCSGEGKFHALFKTDKDATAAKTALEKTGHKVSQERTVVVAEAEDKPGGAAKIYRAIADQEVNVEYTYLATN